MVVPAPSMWGPGRPSPAGRGTILCQSAGRAGCVAGDIPMYGPSYTRGRDALPHAGGSTYLRGVWRDWVPGAVRVCFSRRVVDGVLEGAREGEVVRLLADRDDAWEALAVCHDRQWRCARAQVRKSLHCTHGLNRLVDISTSSCGCACASTIATRQTRHSIQSALLDALRLQCCRASLAFRSS